MKSYLVKIHIFLSLLVYLGASHAIYFHKSDKDVAVSSSKSDKSNDDKSDFQILTVSKEATTTNASFFLNPFEIILAKNYFFVFEYQFSVYFRKSVENIFKKTLFSRISPSNAP